MIPIVAMLPPLLPVDLAWNAPAECPTRDAVVDEVAHVLAQSSGPRPHAAARADVTRDERGQWHAALSVDVDGAHSERGLDAESCRAIATATALIVAIAVEGETPEPTRAVPAPHTPHSPALPPTASRSQFSVAAAGVIDDGLLPAPAPGGEVALGWAYRASPLRIRAAASAILLGEQTATLASPAHEGGSFTAFAASARGCASLVNGALDVGTCLGVEIDTVTAAGSGPPSPTFTPSTKTATWPSVMGSAIVSWSLSRHAAIFLRADGVLPLVRPTFGVVDSSRMDIALHLPAAGPRAALGVEARFF